MTDTPAESAEAPRTPEDDDRDLMATIDVYLSTLNEEAAPRHVLMAIADHRRAALAARDAQLRNVLTELDRAAAQENSGDGWVLVFAATAALRALLSEGKPGK